MEQQAIAEEKKIHLICELEDKNSLHSDQNNEDVVSVLFDNHNDYRLKQGTAVQQTQFVFNITVTSNLDALQTIRESLTGKEFKKWLASALSDIMKFVNARCGKRSYGIQLYLTVTSNLDALQTIKKASTGKQCKKWLASALLEIMNFVKCKMWKKILHNSVLVQGCRPIPVKWVFEEASQR